MNTVFILGAGASREAGAPLMFDFLDKANDLVRNRVPGIFEHKGDFDDVFQAISELQGIYSKAHLDLDNIEVLFGAIEMALLLEKLGQRKLKQIKALKTSLITLIYKTLEHTIPFPVRTNKLISPPAPYEDFIKTITAVNNDDAVKDKHNYAFLTFNYDLCLDFALHHGRMAFDYHLESSYTVNSSPLLKLHGSINWGLLGKTIVPFNIHETKFDPFYDVKQVYYDLGSKLHNKQVKGESLKGPPVLLTRQFITPAMPRIQSLDV